MQPGVAGGGGEEDGDVAERGADRLVEVTVAVAGGGGLPARALPRYLDDLARRDTESDHTVADGLRPGLARASGCRKVIPIRARRSR